jgi:NAD(P)-dependent dehydrogenase (short-subunit alcohol dehydrogenase family)
MKDVWAPGKKDFNVLSPAQMKNWLWNHDFIDTLVLCQGYTHLAWFEDQMPDDLVKQVEVNLTGTMHALSAFVNRTMSERHTRKTIVCVGSMAHNHVLNASAAYCASKAGVAHLVRCLGHELTPKGFYIYGVHPGNVQGTPMAEDTIQGIVEYRHVEHDVAQEYWASGLLMPRFLRAEDVATTIRNLVLSDNGYQSGTNIELSGGMR